MLRSIVAVLVGYALIAIAIAALFTVSFPDRKVQPSQVFRFFSLIYGFVFGIVGGYVCGLITRRSEVKHSVAIAAIGIIFSIVSTAFGTIKELHWYQLANMVVLTVAVLLGGWLRARQKAKNAGSVQTSRGA